MRNRTYKNIINLLKNPINLVIVVVLVILMFIIFC